MRQCQHTWDQLAETAGHGEDKEYLYERAFCFNPGTVEVVIDDSSPYPNPSVLMVCAEHAESEYGIKASL